MSKKIVLSLFLIVVFALSSSLVRAEWLSFWETPVTGSTITVDLNDSPSQGYSVHLKKGEELVVNVNNPNNIWHNGVIDKNYSSNNDPDFVSALNVDIWYGTSLEWIMNWPIIVFFLLPPHSLAIEYELNTNGDPMKYCFKAKDVNPQISC
jgi:hypothetical protein